MMRRMNSLQQIIRDKRIKVGAIAKSLQVNKGTVSRWQNGHREIPLRYVRPLARILGVSIEELIPPEEQHCGCGQPCRMAS